MSEVILAKRIRYKPNPAIVDFESDIAQLLEDGKYLSFASLRDTNDKLNADRRFINMFLYKNKLRRKDELSANSIRAYILDLAYFIEFIYSYVPRRHLLDIGYQELDDYETHLKELIKTKRFATSSARRKLTIVQSMLRYGAKFKFFEHDMSVYIQLPKLLLSRQKRMLTLNEVKAFQEEMISKSLLLRVIGGMLLLCGLRISELCNAKWIDIFEGVNGQLLLRVTGKGNKERIIKMQAELFRHILTYRSQMKQTVRIGHDDGSYLIVNSKGNPLIDRGVREMVARAAKRANIEKKVSPHWLRHASATLALLGGANIKQVQEMLGHEDIRTTERYLHDISFSVGKSANDFILNNDGIPI